ncbi:PH domain-containing protein [Nocardioides sp. SYSU DS0663]|uniref:PH domain-containing protein n=1 Tax=Nocardioides sp. SYSU DS0663 TaxID=3416445 RepID=UPI003F4B4166
MSGPGTPAADGEPQEDPPQPPEAPQAQWQRLDRRMLLVQPVQETIKFLPVLLGLLVAGTASGGRGWQALGLLVPVVLGVLKYLTTRYRIGDGRIELRRGLLARHVLTASVDRVRTVDLTASVVHRLLGLVTVRIGTGTTSTSDDERLDLDGLPVARAQALRVQLLRAAPAAAPSAEEAPPAAPVVVLDPTWARFAPLTSTGLAITAALVGVLTQLADGFGRLRVDDDDLSSWGDRVAGLSVPLAALVAVLALALATSALAVGGYLVANWGFTLVHRDRAWHLRRGLLTTRETSIDDERLSGVTLGEPLGLRAAGGGRLSAIATGLDGQQDPALVPPAPRAVVAEVARSVLGVSGPVDAPLVRHGRAASRRRWTRALGPALLGAGAFAVVAVTRSPWWWVGACALPVAAALLAFDRVRALGHRLVDGYVVSRSGSLYRRRDVLATGDVIGWTFRATWFQRRTGLATLVATTAGGRQSVTVLDVPEEQGTTLAAEAVPGLVEQFLEPSAVSP